MSFFLARLRSDAGFLLLVTHIIVQSEAKRDNPNLRPSSTLHIICFEKIFVLQNGFWITEQICQGNASYVTGSYD